MSRHPRVRRALLLAAALALPFALVPAVTASAADPVPVFSYIDNSAGANSRVLSSANADGSSPVTLTPAGYQTLSYDVTPDGTTELVGLCHGTTANCSGKIVHGYLNVTYALVLVHHDPGYGTKARVVSTWWDGRPALSSSGTAVWMTDGTLYRFAADYSTAGWTTSGTFDTSTAFAPPTGYYTEALAVSADGTKAAVLQWHKNTPHYDWRVLAGDFASGASSSSCFLGLGGMDPWEPDSSTLAFADDSRLMLDTWRFSDSPRIDVGGYQEWPLYAEIATLGAIGPGQCENDWVANPALDNTYDVRQVGSTWYAWYDTAGATSSVSSYGSTTDVTVRPASWTPRSNGSTSFRYVPSAVTPPVLSEPADDLAAAHPYLRLSPTVVAWKHTTRYEVANLYYQPPMVGPYDPDQAGEIDVGLLQSSTDAGLTWHTVVTTSGLSVFKVGTAWYNGMTPLLRRNTWFRWVYPGDLMTAAGSTSSRLVRVVPAITVKVSVTGRSRTVYGSVTRTGGKIGLYRYTAKGYRYVATATITSKGGFTFGKRRLTRGTYKVVAIADTWWAASAKVFKV